MTVEVTWTEARGGSREGGCWRGAQAERVGTGEAAGLPASSCSEQAPKPVRGVNPRPRVPSAPPALPVACLAQDVLRGPWCLAAVDTRVPALAWWPAPRCGGVSALQEEASPLRSLLQASSRPSWRSFFLFPEDCGPRFSVVREATYTASRLLCAGV